MERVGSINTDKLDHQVNIDDGRSQPLLLPQKDNIQVGQTLNNRSRKNKFFGECPDDRPYLG